MVQRNLDAGAALQTYTLLTVGEGLVNQIPALLISTATGIIVTRAASETNLGVDIHNQLFSNQRIFFIATGVLTLLAVVPGLPGIPFMVLAIITFIIGNSLRKSVKDTGIFTKKIKQYGKTIGSSNGLFLSLFIDENDRVKCFF